MYQVWDLLEEHFTHPSMDADEVSLPFTTSHKYSIEMQDFAVVLVVC
jgi:hypothetical protein